MKKKIGNAIGVFLAVLLVMLILSGPVFMITFIVIKNYLYLDLSLIYLVISGMAYYLYRLSIWFESLGKKK